MPTERIIGIDFGTSTSVVKVKTYKDGKPMDAPEFADYVRFDGKSTLPTLVFYLDDGTILAGYEAENAASGYDGELFQNFKLDLVSSDKEAQDRAVRLTKDFFKYIYSVYEDHRASFPACEKETTYVSYPAKWPKEICAMMAEIAAEVGFQNVVGLDEPTAALYAVLVQQGDELKQKGLIQRGKSVNMLMIDMGAGTTDLVLCRYTPGSAKEVEILNTWPKADSRIMFGGREIDEALCGYAKNYLIGCGIADTDELTRMCLTPSKRWKEANVSGLLAKPEGLVKSCGFTGPFLMSMGGERKEFPPIDRNVFEGMLKGYIEQFPMLIHGCISNTEGIRPEDIDLVILTGGHSQWYFASEMLDGSTQAHGAAGLPRIQSEPSRVVRLKLPQETVGLGLVYQRLKVEVEPASEQETEPQPKGNDTGYVVFSDAAISDLEYIIKNNVNFQGTVQNKLKALGNLSMLVPSESVGDLVEELNKLRSASVLSINTVGRFAEMTVELNMEDAESFLIYIYILSLDGRCSLKVVRSEGTLDKSNQQELTQDKLEQYKLRFNQNNGGSVIAQSKIYFVGDVNGNNNYFNEISFFDPTANKFQSIYKSESPIKSLAYADEWLFFQKLIKAGEWFGFPVTALCRIRLDGTQFCELYRAQPGPEKVTKADSVKGRVYFTVDVGKLKTNLESHSVRFDGSDYQ